MDDKAARSRAALLLAVQPTTIVENAFYRVEALVGATVARVVRSDRSFSALDDVRTSCGAVQRALDGLGRASRSLLVDSRLAPITPAPAAVEQAFAKERVDMIRGFRRAAILVASAAGKLHVERLLREDAAFAHSRAFVHEVDALVFLVG